VRDGRDLISIQDFSRIKLACSWSGDALRRGPRNFRGILAAAIVLFFEKPSLPHAADV